MSNIFIRDKHMNAQLLADGRLRCAASLNDTDQIMKLICIVSYPELVLEEVSFEMLRTPGSECQQASDNSQKLLGIQVSPGYNRQVKEALGGVEGCVHMVDLAVEIGKVAVQGKFKIIASEQQLNTKEDKKKYWKGELQGQCVRYN